MRRIIPQLNKKLRDYSLQKMREQDGKKRSYKDQPRVYPLMRQEIDIDKLTKAFIMLAREMANNSVADKTP